MTNYNLEPLTSLSALAAQEAKERRRQVLERAAQIRKANYERFLEKQRATHRDVEEREI
jgi:hypothetical protein